MSIARLYLSDDTSSRAAGAGRLAERLQARPDVQLIRTSSRGAFFLEPMIERDSPEGRVAWCKVGLDDLPRVVAGTGGTPIDAIPYLTRQTRATFANFGITEPLALDEYQSRDGFKGLDAALAMEPEA
ncbi:MAG TPA: formate dehydrogenase, partial [Nitrospira sp.]|nr:formate dehydrogenase [Nitrospira sp.]